MALTGTRHAIRHLSASRVDPRQASRCDLDTYKRYEPTINVSRLFVSPTNFIDFTRSKSSHLAAGTEYDGPN
jgi:hypothetical protein